MAMLLKGAPAAAALNERSAAAAAALKAKGIVPTLAILRVGARDGDLSYERGAMKRCEQIGADVKNVVLPADVEADVFFAALESLNRDDTVHGILMLRPLPKHLDGERARRISRRKRMSTAARTARLPACSRTRRSAFRPVPLRLRWRS